MVTFMDELGWFRCLAQGKGDSDREERREFSYF